MEEIITLPTVRICECPFCEESRFIKRLQALLPEAEASELSNWYCALLDCTADKEMDFYWIEQHLKRLTDMVAEFGKKRA